MNENRNKKSNSCDNQSGKKIYTNVSNITPILSDTGSSSSKRHGRQFRQRHDTTTQRQRHNQQHSTMLQTRILSGEIFNLIFFFFCKYF